MQTSRAPAHPTRSAAFAAEQGWTSSWADVERRFWDLKWGVSFVFGWDEDESQKVIVAISAEAQEQLLVDKFY